jgi:hypothetical protein
MEPQLFAGVSDPPLVAWIVPLALKLALTMALTLALK